MTDAQTSPPPEGEAPPIPSRSEFPTVVEWIRALEEHRRAHFPAPPAVSVLELEDPDALPSALELRVARLETTVAELHGEHDERVSKLEDHVTVLLLELGERTDQGGQGDPEAGG